MSDEIDHLVMRAAEVAKAAGSSDLPMSLRGMLDNGETSGKVNWRELLHDFIQITNDNYDYSFSPIDKRYSDSPYLMPSFYDIEDQSVENLRFVVDTSASIDDEMLGEIYTEIKSAIMQFSKLSFFDMGVTKPEPFEDIESLTDVMPVGGGDTSFHRIFDYMEYQMEDDLPAAVIIMTDGYAQWPDEERTQGVPVMWIIIDSERQPPWGEVVHI